MRAAVVLMTAAMAAAQTPDGVIEVLRVAAESLAEQDTQRFFSLFDPEMEALPELRRQIALLVAREGAASTIDIASDTGDEDRREVRLNWLLRVGAGPARRGEVSCRLARREGRWKIIALSPVEFFRPSPP